MELTIAAQDDSTPWELPTLSLNPSTAAAAVVSMNGRGYFSQLGVVRRKPSRPDAPPTLSKSCSDKIALHQCTSLLSSMASLIMSPENVYIHSLVLPQSQYSAVGCERCFSSQGRMTKLTGFIWGEGYKFSPFNTMTTTCEFGFSRRAFQDGESAVPSNLAAVWTPHGQENLIGGVLQGRKLFDPKGASMLSKQRMWQLVNEIIEVLNGSDALVATLQGTYIAVKNSPALKERRKVKNEVRDLLQGWTPNVGDESFSLENNKCSIAF
jgi:tRNA-specific adenosine deaminase 1